MWQHKWLEIDMKHLFSILLAALVSLSACAPAPSGNRLGADGLPLPQLYRIRARDADNIQFRMLDAVNALRSANGVQQVALNAQLNAAAATHSRDMSVQNRPWHFGSDGSSPIDRVARVGFTGALVGENISETYESELETLGAWMSQPDTRRIILSPDADSLGFSWFQENSGKIWWTMIMGDSSSPRGNASS
jgi:uncharacterized protein YkwD